MAFVAPLKGVRYNTDKIDKLAEVVTPPYDIINENVVENYIQKNPYSMIRLDITKNPGPLDITDSRYHEAASLFEQWLEEGLLIREKEDAIYLYSVEYLHPSGGKLVRKGLVCLVGLSNFGEGIVKPHEQTFDSVIADRLKLTEHCKAQFSQIFSLYTDKENKVLTTLEKEQGEILASVTDADGCTHTISAVSDAKTIEQVQQLFLDKALYIADGHHRYSTALAYRDKVKAQRGELAISDPANHIIMYLCPMEDPGLSVLPTHRLVNWPGRMLVKELLGKIEPFFTAEEIKGGSREVLTAEVLSRMDELERLAGDKNSTTFGVYHPDEDRCFLLTLRPDARNELGDKPDELKDLDVLVLSELIIEKALELGHEECEQENLIHYFSDPDEAMDVAVKSSLLDEKLTPIFFLMNPTRMEQVKNVADKNLIMPHKSTFFFPKVLTGLLFNKLVEGEKINRLG